MAKSLLDRTAVTLFKNLPTKAAQHLLFLAQSEREVSDRWGYHIRPIHYYEPLPDFRSITAEQVTRRRNYPAIDFNWSEQLDLLDSLAAFRTELTQLDFDFQNDYFSGFDAAVFYSLIRHLQPQRVIEIGGGYSTRIAIKALSVNRKGTLTCIEPYPERLNGAHRSVELIQKRVEEMEVGFFSCLQPNDILFIDSSHTVKFGSDVCYEFLEILPSIAPGVWVHVHDIFFPEDYPAEWLIKRRLALNEQYLLEAFLSFNNQFRVALSNHWLCLDHSAAASRLWPSSEVDSSSFWFYRL
ncbi:MAG TPA: class I SAM-dependent methyltransferase [Pyrinomonadaceae bacterium]|nr:class I SAM-dependent methyltransferase [Pyrinomonadaceae bacterium]